MDEFTVQDFALIDDALDYLSRYTGVDIKDIRVKLYKAIIKRKAQYQDLDDKFHH